MELSDLKDPRDREHAARDQRAPSIHNIHVHPTVRSKRSREMTAGYDKLVDREFNQGLENA